MPRLKRAPRGAVLAELVVAFTLASLVAAAAAVAMAGVERYARRTSLASEDRRTVREAEQSLAGDLRAAAADSLVLRGDTAAEFVGLVGTSVACVVGPSHMVLPSDLSTIAVPFTVWRALPASGDLVAVFDTTPPGAWRIAFVDSVTARPDGAGCTPATGFVSSADSAARRPASRLLLDRSLGAGVGAGAPVRLLRRGRYVLTHAADRSWSLSYRSCDAARVCGVAQPVAGPLATPSDLGLVFALDARAARLEAAVRTPLREAGSPRTSRHVIISLRNRVGSVP